MPSNDHDGFVEDNSADRADPAQPQVGGLLTRKTPAAGGERHVFKVPTARPSLLGLDRLAAEKRNERAAREEESQRKKVKLSSTAEWEAGAEGGESLVISTPTPRLTQTQYRPKRMETPSHHGGLSEEARERLDRNNREKDKFKWREMDETGGIGGAGTIGTVAGVVMGGANGIVTVTASGTPGVAKPMSAVMAAMIDSPGVRRSVRPSDWERSTPRVSSTSYEDNVRKPTEADFAMWEQEQAQVDRDWYNTEESGAIDESHNQFSEYEAYYRKKEEELAKQQVKKLSAKQAQYNRDNDLWETNRMLTSGIVQRRQVDTDFDDESEVTTR
ncbi:hypothetical protein BDK51DRAFT_33046 [Blyttiomyces helicus]|uniref:Uncharacterized protein n=1 Tax=Blyttiomyces helicus TaxID=388810 RepID=A0A4P9WJR7_9FUNG|nr:hypothetical protein BDK51DRAFT_33046 [Blyttiomyces helicus]|eukprot:RKO91778.1 hypothetical protein BDK51DRAFT_33046 [Blyttiomyces helicus]